MDSEKRARRQSIRLIVSETIMVLAVVVMVVILAFLVSGYWLGSDFQLERQGMLQINSMPTGATVAVDGEAPWYQRTNTSKVLSSGEHTVSLAKDGYDSWSRTINIRDGLLYRIYYPRLFLLERTKETVLNSPTVTMATISPDHKWMLLVNNTTTWQLVNLMNEKPEASNLSVATQFDSVSLASGATTGLFTGKIASVNWSGDNEHVLIQSQYNNSNEWVVLNIKKLSESVNLTREFATTFDDIRIFDNSASVLLALKGTNLHKIDVSARQISAVLIDEVQNYDIYGSEIIFTASIPAGTDYDVSDELLTPKNSNNKENDTSEDATIKDSKTPKYYTGITRVSDTSQINYVTSSMEPILAYISRFYDEKYITIIADDLISVYKYNEDAELIFEGALDFKPSSVKISYDGGFVFMNSGNLAMTFDMEALELVSWSLDAEDFGWVDGHTVYSVNNGTLVVYDFDGLNRREISINVSVNFPVTITDNKWLYYFSDDKLIREIIMQ